MSSPGTLGLSAEPNLSQTAASGFICTSCQSPALQRRRGVASQSFLGSGRYQPPLGRGCPVDPPHATESKILGCLAVVEAEQSRNIVGSDQRWRRAEPAAESVRWVSI